MKGFIKHHILAILRTQDKSFSPMDSFLRRYFRENRAVGSHDRKEICETLYTMIKQKALIDFFCPKPLSWENRLQTTLRLDSIDPYLIKKTPLHIQASFPKFLYDKFIHTLSAKAGHETCLISNGIAPVTARINPAKTTREEFLQECSEYNPTATKQSPLGVTIPKKLDFFSWPIFKQGHFEIQDEGSQIVADFMKVKSGDHVLDYCAGSGGKTLAFAHKMEGKGQIYLHDIRDHALANAKIRLKRAGIQNAQLTTTKVLKKKRFEKKMDWILLDVPCSGSGTLRRNPEIKWKLSQDDLDQLVQTQRDIFENALHFLKPNGKVVYATCSIFKEENENQIAYFEEQYGLKRESKPFQSLPTQGGMDGFFTAVLSRPK